MSTTPPATPDLKAVAIFLRALANAEWDQRTLDTLGFAMKFFPHGPRLIRAAADSVEQVSALRAEVEALRQERDHERHEKETVVDAGQAFARHLNQQHKDVEARLATLTEDNARLRSAHESAETRVLLVAAEMVIARDEAAELTADNARLRTDYETLIAEGAKRLRRRPINDRP